jgi:DNA-binding FrmR family transcriptional regulator
MAKEPVSREVLIKRLKRIEGQVRGIQKMIESERDCESILTQLAAARSAIEGVGALVLNNYMQLCFLKEEPSTEDSSTAVDSLARCVAVWGRVRVGDSGH